MDKSFLMEEYNDGSVKCEMYYGFMSPFVKVVIGSESYIFKSDEDPNVVFDKLPKYSFTRKVAKRFVVEDLNISYIEDEDIVD